MLLAPIVSCHALRGEANKRFYLRFDASFNLNDARKFS
jgi:hypothetical protein